MRAYIASSLSASSNDEKAIEVSLRAKRSNLVISFENGYKSRSARLFPVVGLDYPTRDTDAVRFQGILLYLA